MIPCCAVQGSKYLPHISAYEMRRKTRSAIIFPVSFGECFDVENKQRRRTLGCSPRVIIELNDERNKSLTTKMVLKYGHLRTCAESYANFYGHLNRSFRMVASLLLHTFTHHSRSALRFSRCFVCRIMTIWGVRKKYLTISGWNVEFKASQTKRSQKCTENGPKSEITRHLR